MKARWQSVPALLALLWCPRLWAADSPGAAWQWLPGDAREISHANSASRDTAALEAIVAPRFSVTLGSELGIVSFRGAGSTWRLGALAFFGLESRTRSRRLFPAPGGDSDLWRGLLAYELACSFDEFAQRHLGERGALELSLGYYHESDHHTASPGVPATSADELLVRHSQIGNFVAADLGLRFARYGLVFVLRQQAKLFRNGTDASAPFRAGTAGEFVLELPALSRAAVPFWSNFGEVLLEPGHASTRSFRSLLGVGLPGRAGAVRVYASFDDGAGKGLLIRDHERALGLGFRFTPFDGQAP